MKPAVNTAQEFAKDNGSPYGILISTTPNNLDVPEGLFVYKMIQDAAKFDEKLFYDNYDWIKRDSQTISDYIENNSNNNFVYIEFSYLELGRDEKWLKNQIKELNNDMLIVKRELLLQWTYASSVSPFSEEQLTVLEENASRKNYSSKIYIDNYVIDVVEQPKNMINKNWIIGIDVGGGLGIDGSAFTLIDPATMLPTMKFNNNMISIPDYAELIEKFVNSYVPNAIIVPERNNAGIALIQLLLKSSVSDNLFYEIRDKKAEVTINKNESIFRSSNHKKVNKETRVFGMTTSTQSRDIMINQILFMIVNDKPYLINNKELFDNIRTLYRNPKGKIEHQQGFHDDLLFSYLIGLYVLLYSKSINKFLKNVSDLVSDEKTKSENSNLLNTIRNINNLGNEESTNEKLMREFQETMENSKEIHSQEFIKLNNDNLKKSTSSKLQRIIDLNKM